MHRRREAPVVHGVEGGDSGTANGNHHYDGVQTAYKPHQPPTEERKRTWWLVGVVALANVVVFVVTMYRNNCPRQSNKCVASRLRRFSFQPFRENPLYGPSARTLWKMGALARSSIVHQHQGWRLVSSIALHAGVIHLGVSVISLLFVGIRLEQQFGFLWVGTIYLVSGFGGSVVSALFSANSYHGSILFVHVGASGALFGLLGAAISEIITNWTIYTNKAAALIILLVIIAINSAVGILPYVGNFAHIGGFLTGFFLGFVLLVKPQFRWLERHHLPAQTQAKSKYNPCQIMLLLVSLLLLIVGFAASLITLYNDDDLYGRCYRWCRYLYCVPTSKWECGF